MLAGLWMTTLAAPAGAELSSRELEKLPEITEWIYRNSVAAEAHEPCHEACEALWRDEHGPMITGGAT